MAFSMLSQIHKYDQKWTICVYVSRLWHFRGGTDEGTIQHTDLVLLDAEGTHMYGQVPAKLVDRFKDVLKEGKVFVIKKFLCTESRTSYRPVESPFMVQFTRFTMVEEKPGTEEAYPFCTYNLTALADVPAPSNGPPARFVDVMGKITMVSDIIPVQSNAQTTPSNTRTVMLVDLLGNEMKVVLWGDRAVEFDAEAVRVMGAKEPVIAIFVGTLPKMSRGILSLSGSSPCRWYIDEDIPDINSFREGLGEQFIPLASYAPTGPDAIMPRAQQAPTDKTVLELTDLDPFEEMDNRFVCTVTVERLGGDQRWWFPSCMTCRKSAKLAGNQFRCSGDTCLSVKAELAYCVSVFASDGTGEAEFVMFDKVAAKAISKSLMTLLSQRHPGYTTSEELASVAKLDTVIPPELTRLIGQKYKLLVSISKKWRLNNSENLSFQINRIEETYKPELPPLLVPAAAESAGTSSTTGSGIQIPSVLPVLPPAAFTPRSATASPAAKLSPSTPAKGSSAPRRGTARRALFGTPPKDKTNILPDIAEPTEEETDLSAGPVVDDVMEATEGKDGDILPPRTKRPLSALKSGGKKQR